jgi:hypothetical protein
MPDSTDRCWACDAPASMLDALSTDRPQSQCNRCGAINAPDVAYEVPADHDPELYPLGGPTLSRHPSPELAGVWLRQERDRFAQSTHGPLFAQSTHGPLAGQHTSPYLSRRVVAVTADDHRHARRLTDDERQALDAGYDAGAA